MLSVLPLVCVLDFSRHNHRVSQSFYHLALHPRTAKLQLSSNSVTVWRGPQLQNTTRIEKMTEMLRALQNLTYRWQLVDICYDLLVPLDRLPGARPQRGAEVAKAAAGGQNPPWHYPHFPSLWFDQQWKNKLSKSSSSSSTRQTGGQQKERAHRASLALSCSPKIEFVDTIGMKDETAQANNSRQNSPCFRMGTLN
jgi:hypothetical protein